MKKKMNIGTLGTSLSRNEMKKIMAGSGGGGNCKTNKGCPSGCACKTVFEDTFSCCEFACCIAVGEN